MDFNQITGLFSFWDVYTLEFTFFIIHVQSEYLLVLYKCAEF